MVVYLTEDIANFQCCLILFLSFSLGPIISFNSKAMEMKSTVLKPTDYLSFLRIADTSAGLINVKGE
jgi:hypothetical protein